MRTIADRTTRRAVTTAKVRRVGRPAAGERGGAGKVDVRGWGRATPGALDWPSVVAGEGGRVCVVGSRTTAPVRVRVRGA